MTYKIVPGALLLDQLSAKQQHWIIKGVVPRRGVMGIYSPHGHGKTFLTIDMLSAIHRATRIEEPTFLDDPGDVEKRNANRPAEWNSHRLKFAGPVVLWFGEGNPVPRFAAYSRTHADTRELPYVFTAPIALHAPDCRERMEALATALKPIGPAAVFFDTLARATSGADENSAKDMGAAMGALQYLSEQLDCLVGFVAHAGKDTGKGLRGSTAIAAAVDTLIEITKRDDVHCAEVVKQRDGETGGKFFFKLEPVELPPDEDGDPRSSCVVRYVPKEQAGRKVKADFRGEYQLAIRDGLAELAGGGESANRSAVIDAALARLPTDTKRETIRKGISRLISDGKLFAHGQDRVGLDNIRAVE